MEIESKVTGSALTASEFNQIPDEMENLIAKSGQTASASDLTQIAKAVAQFVSDGDFYATSGTENAIVLSAVAPRVAPTALTNGMRVRFKANYDNTQAVTVNVNNLGAKNITVGGQNISTGKLSQNRFYELTYSSSTDTFELFESGSGSGGRNVGEVITSTLPLTDAGLHLLDGSLLQYGIYKEFIDYIADLYAENPSANYFTTEALWQQSVTNYGSCGKFVYDSTNNTVRLPKVSDILQGTTDLSALGDLVEAGLPNITGHIETRFRGQFYNGTGAFKLNTSIQDLNGNGSNSAYQNADFNASYSNSIYGNSTTVQPQTVKILYYIVVATSTKTEIQSDIDEIATDLNSKADTDLTNCTDVANIKMAHNAMPSNTYVNLTLGASGSTYTAPADGYFSLRKYSNDVNQLIGLYQTNNDGVSSEVFCPTANMDSVIYIPVRKGQVISCWYSMGGNTVEFRFIYAKGSESEAS